MKTAAWMMTVLAVLMVFPGGAQARGKKKIAQRAMIENMEAIPCGAKQHGITGLGSLWASAGIEHVNSDEKLCPQYLLRTDEMEYQIRPEKMKHAVLLPVGQEAEFKIKKDVIQLKIPDGDRKMREYQVVAVNPVKSAGPAVGEQRRPPESPAAYPSTPKTDGKVTGATNHPPL